MNYIVEDNIDFFEEIAKSDEPKVETCLLTGAPLTRNCISLGCTHKFNYVPIFNEIKKQKSYNPNSHIRLYPNQIQCPYCRQISNSLIPYIPAENNISKVKGVNYPKTMCMKYKTCGWRYKTGKRKGQCCSKDGFETEYGDLCERHWLKCIESTKQQDSNIWTPEMEILYKNSSVVSLKETLRTKHIKMTGNKKDLVMRVVNNS